MIKWYNDKNLAIYFSDTPHVCVRYICPSSTDEEKKAIKKYPFICKTELKVVLFDKKKITLQPNPVGEGFVKYNFTIPKGYCYDGASIPRAFWRVVGSPMDNRFLIAALIHDVLCENHSYVNNDRAFSTNVFNALLTVSDVNCCQRFLMKNSVGMFQTLFCKWGKKKPDQGDDKI